MPQTEDTFQALLLREFVKEPGLAREAGFSDDLHEIVMQLGQHAGPLVKWLLGAEAGPIASLRLSDLSQQALFALATRTNVLLIVRGLVDVIATLRSQQEKYASTCRSALCHAVVGEFSTAMGALRVAAAVDDRWGRHHHIYGLIHGATGHVDSARGELQQAFDAEPYPEPRARIQEALAAIPPAL